LGIDASAHEGALAAAAKAKAQLTPLPTLAEQSKPGFSVSPQYLAQERERVWTLAVVGTGLDRVYPSENQKLAHRIAEQGTILSEFPIGTPPLRANFPKRNRLIAGLSLGTVVVEASLQSGSLITARLAVEQGKEVFAMPGSIHSLHVKGCHALIKQGAQLVEGVADVLEGLHLGHAMPPPVSASPKNPVKPKTTPPPKPREKPTSPENAASFPSLPKYLAPLYQALEADLQDIDTLQARTGLDTATLQAQLLELELTGHATRAPGGMFGRLVRV
jgi:DNA processing protein